MDLKILRRPQVEKATGLAKSSIYEKIERDEFPRPIKLGERAVGWLESDVKDWLNAKIAKRDDAKAA